MALGARPRRAVLGGTGLDPIVHAAGRGDNYRRLFARLGTFAPGTPEAQMEAVHGEHRRGPDRAELHVLDTFVDTPREALAAVEVPTLVIAGEDDTARGSVEDLAAVLPNAGLLRVPGDHLTALLGGPSPTSSRPSWRRTAPRRKAASPVRAGLTGAATNPSDRLRACNRRAPRRRQPQRPPRPEPVPVR